MRVNSSITGGIGIAAAKIRKFFGPATRRHRTSPAFRPHLRSTPGPTTPAAPRTLHLHSTPSPAPSTPHPAPPQHSEPRSTATARNPHLHSTPGTAPPAAARNPHLCSTPSPAPPQLPETRTPAALRAPQPPQQPETCPRSTPSPASPQLPETRDTPSPAARTAFRPPAQPPHPVRSPAPDADSADSGPDEGEHPRPIRKRPERSAIGRNNASPAGFRSEFSQRTLRLSCFYACDFVEIRNFCYLCIGKVRHDSRRKYL